MIASKRDPTTGPPPVTGPRPGDGRALAPGDLDRDLLCISQSFAPDTTPTGIRAGKLVNELAASWNVTVMTETVASSNDHVSVVTVRSRRPGKLLAFLHRMRLSKLLELVIWPDDSIFWIVPAVIAGYRLVRERRPSAIVVFMMPYSAGFVGLALARVTRVPLVLNLDDSPTCTDMHPEFPSRLHYRFARALENLYARRADALVYVSKTNLELVAARQPPAIAKKLHLVRYGADQTDFNLRQPSGESDTLGESFEIVYVGAMTGWWTLIDEQTQSSWPKRIYQAWMQLGRYERTKLDLRTASPAVVGDALAAVLGERPDWRGRVAMRVYDSSYSPEVIGRALAAAGIEQVVTVREAVAHERVAEILTSADLLFLTLPRRVDGTPGGRVSAKTYEYLMTDRPILAAVSAGENRDYLSQKPGVWLVEPDDVEGMSTAIAELAAAKFAGEPRTFARERVRQEISYTTRAREFEQVIRAASGRDRAGGAGR